jgi:hypothetical protein
MASSRESLTTPGTGLSTFALPLNWSSDGGSVGITSGCDCWPPVLLLAGEAGLEVCAAIGRLMNTKKTAGRTPFVLIIRLTSFK